MNVSIGALLGLLTILATPACSSYKSTYKVPSSQDTSVKASDSAPESEGSHPSADGTGRAVDSDSAPNASGSGMAHASPTINTGSPFVQLLSARLAGSGSKYQVIARFGNFSSPKTKLQEIDGGLQFQLAQASSAKSDVLTLEVYEGDALRFIAKRAQTQFSGNARPAVTVKDCQLLEAPWKGDSNTESCGWSIEDAK